MRRNKSGLKSYALPDEKAKDGDYLRIQPWHGALTAVLRLQGVTEGVGRSTKSVYQVANGLAMQLLICVKERHFAHVQRCLIIGHVFYT